MKQLAALYVATAMVFLGLDAVWLSTMANRLYKPALQGVLAANFRPVPALLFYMLYIGGIVGFAVLPAEKPLGALLRGAAFGLVAYATYDLTNQATLARWSTRVTLADLAWGALATAVAAAVARAMVRV
ncbi:DUF2177 family protein [Acidocella sp.]|uniref:DUF2177 family protein n=1 Tax=Acidocella sp. TaxID=50710 RepID=UPI00262640CE|nr:DUF2177 family protein [Acidocella sp.]